MDEGSLPGGAGIGRVALRVADLEDSAAFYEAALGLERLDPASVADTAPPATEDRAVLGAGGEPLLLLDGAPDAPDRGPTAAGLYHVAIRVPDRPTLGSAIARLRERDLIDGAADHGVSEAIYLRDPEGNGLELYVDRPREEWQTDGDHVAMVTDPLDLEELVDLADEPAATADAGAPPDAAALPTGTTIGHVHLEVTDPEATRAFYADALGMRLRQRFGEEALFLAAGDYHHHVGANTWRRRTEPAGESRGLAWFEVLLPTSDALEDVADRLERSDVQLDRSNGVLTVADPDGVDLRLRVDGAIAAPTGE